MTSNHPHVSSTDSQTAASGQPSPRPADPAASGAKLDLSLTQILGGALAAMTAAALGSRLGVAGTITGAAVASVVAGVAGSLYTASLRHTKEKMATALIGHRSEDGAPAPAAVGSEAPRWPDPAPLPIKGRGSRRGLRWAGVIVAAVATFAVTIVALTGFEALAGSALSGGRGTTIEQVSKQKPAKHSDSKSGDTPSPSKSTTATHDPTPTTSEKPSNPAPSSTEPTTNPTTSTPESSKQAKASQQPSATDAPTTTAPSSQGTPAG